MSKYGNSKSVQVIDKNLHNPLNRFNFRPIGAIAKNPDYRFVLFYVRRPKLADACVRSYRFENAGPDAYNWNVSLTLDIRDLDIF